MLRSINKIIKVLAASDVALLTGFGFIAPIFAIFVSERITLGSAKEAVMVTGFAMAVYWGVKSILQIPFGKYLDQNHGEKDDLYFVIIGNFLAAISAFGFIFAYMPWHIYLLKGIYSLGMAMNVPAWSAIFTRHIDKGKEAFEWSTRSTAIGIGAAVSGALGGVVAGNFGFNVLFVGVGIFVLISAFLPILIYKDICPRNKKTSHVPKAKALQEPDLPKQ